MPDRMRSLWLPHPGEMIFSVFVRQYYTEWHPTAGRYFRDHLDARWDAPSTRTLLPPFVKLIEQRVPEGHPWSERNYLVEHHSPIPFITLFQSQAVKEELTKRWFTKKSPFVRSYIGAHQTTCPVQPQLLRYCHRCVELDLKASVPPLPYWRIVHQLPGVFVCPDHQVLLSDGCMACDKPNSRSPSVLLPGMCTCGLTKRHRTVISPFKPSIEGQRVIARWVRDALHAKSSLDLEGRSLWGAIKWIVGNRHTAHDLQKRLVRAYGENGLKYSGVSFKVVKRSLQRVVRTSMLGEAISNILCASVYFDSLEEFRNALEGRGKSALVESGPVRRWGTREKWRRELPELLAKHGKNFKKIARATGRSPLTVKGATYEMVSKKAGDRLVARYPRVVSLLRKGLEKKEVSELTGVSKNTVARVCFVVPELQDQWERASWLLYRDEHRTTFLNARKKVRLGHQLDLDQKYGRASSWLRKHDNLWFVQQLARGLETRPVGVSNEGNIRRGIDWDLRDRQLLEWLSPRIENVRRTSPQYRITLSTLLAGHPDSNLAHRKPARYKRSHSAMAAVTESQDEFCRRRIGEAVRSGTLSSAPAISRKYVARLTNLQARTVSRNWDFVVATLKRGSTER